jgi:hypothetical protein
LGAVGLHGSCRRATGSSLIWTTVVLTVLTAFCSLAVDWGRVQLVKTELRHAADAAARYAAPALPQGIAAVRTRARDVAGENRADGRAVALADGDVEQGRWVPETKTFVVNGAPADAIRITVRRAGADAVPLMFARVIGLATADVSASAVVLAPQSVIGFTGLNGITFKNNTFIGSYDSASLTRPTKAQSTGQSLLSSNSKIEAHNHVELDGNVVIGPAGSVTGVQIDGKTTRKSSALSAPATPAAGTGTNPLGVPADYTISSPTVLPAGTYRFTALTVNANLSFSGVAVVHVNGDISVDNFDGDHRLPGPAVQPQVLSDRDRAVLLRQEQLRNHGAHRRAGHRLRRQQQADVLRHGRLPLDQGEEQRRRVRRRADDVRRGVRRRVGAIARPAAGAPGPNVRQLGSSDPAYGLKVSKPM